MFPHRVVLRIHERSPDDSLVLSETKEMLFEEKLSTGAVLQHMIEQKRVGGVLRNDEEIVRSGISQHISHRNVTAIRTNRLVHCKMHRQPYRHEVFDDGTHFLRRSIVSDFGNQREVGERCRIASFLEDGMRLEFAERTETFSFDGSDRADDPRRAPCQEGQMSDIPVAARRTVRQYVIRAYNKGLVRSTRVNLVGLPTAENRNNYTFRNSDDGKDVTVNR